MIRDTAFSARAWGRVQGSYEPRVRLSYAPRPDAGPPGTLPTSPRPRAAVGTSEQSPDVTADPVEAAGRRVQRVHGIAGSGLSYRARELHVPRRVAPIGHHVHAQAAGRSGRSH
ncbi:hypothetical protein GCM10027073_39430 [Streptomyces chlorus]